MREKYLTDLSVRLFGNRGPLLEKGLDYRNQGDGVGNQLIVFGNP
jgi:hypothetical protein